MKAWKTMINVWVALAMLATGAAYAGEETEAAKTDKPKPARTGRPEPLPAEKNPQYYIDLGNINLRYEEHQKAVDLFLKAIELQDDEKAQSRVARSLATAYIALDKPDKAEAVVDSAMEHIDELNRSSFLISAARMFRDKQFYKKAEKFLLLAKQEARRERTRMRADAELMTLYMGTPLGKKMVREYKERFQKDPKDVQAIKMLMNLYLYQSNFEAAKNMAGHYLRLNPDSVEALQDLSLIYTALGDLEKTLELTMKLIEIDPANKANYYPRIIHLYSAQKKVDEAEKWADKAAKGGVEIAGTYNALAQAYQKAGRRDEAMECYKKAVKGDPKNDRLKLTYAKLLAEEGKTDEAKEILEPLTKNKRANIRDRALKQMIAILKGEDPKDKGKKDEIERDEGKKNKDNKSK